MPSLLQRSSSHHDKKIKKYGTVAGTADSARRSNHSITDPAFFDQDMSTAPHEEILEEMVVDATNVVANGEAETPSGHDDGPWSISVADAPSHNNKKKYTIYIQTPTQNLTLTRPAQEITDLHTKLRSNHPNTALPPLPGFPSSGTDGDNSAKRRSSFLNTLSRLANPSPKASKAKAIAMSPTNASTPMIAPMSPTDDAPPLPSVSQPTGTAPGDDGPVQQTMPALAAYLTLVGNHPIFRHSRAWRRFVRVRTDDLESVRAERVVKRVRSESGLGQNGRDVRNGKPVPEIPQLPTMSSLDVRGSVSDASEGIAEEDEDDTAQAPEKDLPVLPGSSERTPSNKHTPLPETGLIPPVSEILASPSMQQAIATPLPPGTPEPSTPPQKNAGLPGVGSATPTADGQTLPTPGATPTTSPPRAKDAPAENRLSTGSDVFATGSGSEADNAFGGFGNETENEGEFGAETETDVEKTGDGAPKKKKKEKKAARKVVVDDFEMMRVLGKGCAGKVLLVRHRATTELYALKAITKRHVLAHQELQHTLTEQAVLKRMARESRDPFVVKLWWSFHDRENLFLVMDFHPGGDLATQLARWGRLGRDRARFYAAEIVEGCEGLHAAGVIYRDLKPENILIGGDGHIVLTDFGLSKEFPSKLNGQLPPSAPTTPGVATPHWMDAAGSPGRASTSKRLDRDMTSTFCGTAEYLAPEVIQGLPYSYEVDWWSFGTMLYEMLTGITPFWANNHSDMYVRVLQDELQFPDDKAMDQDTKSLIRGLLQRNPALRMCEPRVKKHPYFSMIDWQHVYYKRYIPPYIPPIDPANAGDTQNFDEAFLDMEPVIADETDPTDSEREDSDSESARTASGGKSPERPAPAEGEETVDVFDGYSFKGRDSIIIDDEEESDDDEHEEDEEDDDRIRDAEVLEPEVGGGPITVDESQATPHPNPSELPQTPGAKTSTLPEAEPVTPTTPTAEVPEPPAPVEKPKSKPEPVVAKPKPITPVASPPLDVAQLPPLPAEKPGELVEPVVSPVAARVASPPAEPSSPPAQPRTKQKREKSGVTALDRVLDADTDDEDWDLVEKPGGEDMAYNGRTSAGAKQGNNLFARGVVDRYRLTVFRKSMHAGSSRNPRSGHTSMADLSMSPGTSDAANTTVGSPTPSDSKRRGRSAGLSIRKSTRQFLRAKSPPATFSAGSGSSSRAQLASLQGANTTGRAAGAANNESGLLSPAPSVPAVPSLKSKSSALSGTSPASPGSSDPSISDAPGPSGSRSVGDLVGATADADSETLRRKSLTSKMPAVPESSGQGKKSKKTKKSGTGKMLSLFTLDTKR